MKKFLILVALVLGITAPSSAQTFVGGENINLSPAEQKRQDSIKKVKEMMARVDSMAPATDHGDTLAQTADTAQKALSPGLPVLSKNIVRGNNGNNQALAEEKKKAGHEMSKSQRWGMWGYLAPIFFALIWGFIVIRKRSWFKNPFKSRKERLEERLERVTLKQKIKTLIANSGVDRKRYAIEKLVRAFMKESKITIKENLSVEEADKFMKSVLNRLLEDRRYLRYDFRPLLWVSAVIIGFGLVGALTLMAFNQPEKIIIKNEMKIIEPAPTPTVTPVKVEVPIEEEPVAEQAPGIPRLRMYTKTIHVPAEGLSESWRLPPNSLGWRFTVQWGSPNIVWYPEDWNMDKYVTPQADDIGSYNSPDTNFQFESTSGRPETVTIRYWSKNGRS